MRAVNYNPAWKLIPLNINYLDLFLQMCELTFNLSNELILCQLPFKVNNILKTR